MTLDYGSFSQEHLCKNEKKEREKKKKAIFKELGKLLQQKKLKLKKMEKKLEKEIHVALDIRHRHKKT